MDENENQKKESAREGVSAPASQPSSTADPDRHLKDEMLRQDNSLRRQHDELVVGADGCSPVLSDEEFWLSRRDLLAERSAAKRAEEQGLRTALLADLQVDTVDGVQHLRVSEEGCRNILRMYDGVRTVYEQKVPMLVTEQEFWSQYFNSSYYKRDKGQITDAEDLHHADKFTDMVTKAESDRAKQEAVVAAMGKHAAKTLKTGVGPAFDLTLQHGDLHAQEQKDQEDRIFVHKSRVVEKVNRHSSLIALEGAPSLKRKQFDYSADLATSDVLLLVPPHPHSQFLPLNLLAETRTDSSGTSSTSLRSLLGVEQISCEHAVKEALGDMRQCIPSSAVSLKILKESSCSDIERDNEIEFTNLPHDLQKFIKEHGYSDIERDNEIEFTNLPHDLQEFIKEHFMTLKELLRHFYSGISQSKSSQINERVKALEKSLEEKRSVLASKRAWFTSNPTAFKYYKELDNLYCKAFDVYDSL